MRLTRSEVLAGAAASALGAAGVYELVDRLTRPATRARVRPRGLEQHLLDGVQTVTHEGVEVVVPPLHHQVVTARLRVAEDPASLRDAAAELERRLAWLETLYQRTPAGLGVTLAWGLPYFERYVPGQAQLHLPFDRRAGKDALLDAIRFPSDPDELILEANDVAVLLRSDRLDAVADGARVLFPDDDSIFAITSIRKGFAGGGFGGGQSLPKQMAVAAGVPGAELIPDTAELFLGFTSTQRATLGPSRIANFETLGFVDVRNRYFRGGTHMHLSHIFENLEAWYLNFDFRERVDTTFHPGLDVRHGAQTVGQREPVPMQELEAVFRRAGRIGHGAAIQATSRLGEGVVGPDGTRYPRGTAIPQRADFNTLDNPFFWSSTPERDGMADGAAAGVHFLTFNPSSDDFRRNRLAMDGILPDGHRLELEPRSRGQGINSVLRGTHRQNFLVPPRAHRALPLAELRA